MFRNAIVYREAKEKGRKLICPEIAFLLWLSTWIRIIRIIIRIILTEIVPPFSPGSIIDMTICFL